ncbi:MAG: SAM-dependent DNA methyltransferase, partial [Thermoguttaceae bacterium]|nr:SAM-dependent DNA methyltransferase [Thermoguttaceae bacterium]
MNHAIHQFVETARSLGYEKGDTQKFWNALLQGVYGIKNLNDFIEYEYQVQVKNICFIDAIIKSMSVLIEQKSANVNLENPSRQSDGKFLTPFEQARKYNDHLPHSERCRWIIVCNFREFHIHNMETPNAPPEVVYLEKLEEEPHVLDFLVDKTQTKVHREEKLSIAAGELVGKLYDALLAQYIDPTSPETLRSLNILCVRLVFCFYAEDADILGKHNCVCTYLAKRKNDIRRALIDLFHILNQKQEERDPYLDDDLKAFPYVNGGLFEGDVEIPRITPEIAKLLTEECSLNFDWSGISPTIFGAVFESTLNPETRRSGGMHYTATKNIHRVIGPLFLEDLQKERMEILTIPVDKTREKRLKEFRNRLASLTFFDPACGSGNFLTETYLEIRKLENAILRALVNGQMQMSDVAIQVGIDQFYGIEINDFAVSVARTALWIAESQMLKETEGIINRTLDFLPLRTHANIVEGNALRLDWETVVPRDRLNYIIGNPPFVGARFMSPEQKNDLVKVFGEDWKNVGNLDYVCAW